MEPEYRQLSITAVKPDYLIDVNCPEITEGLQVFLSSRKYIKYLLILEVNSSNLI